MSDKFKPFQNLTKDVPVDIRSPEWNNYRFGLVSTTFLYSKDGQNFLTQVPPDDYDLCIALYGGTARPICVHEDCLGQSWCTLTGRCSHVYCEGLDVCQLPWLRVGAYCGHADCYSLLRCMKLPRPLTKGTERDAGSTSSDEGSLASSDAEDIDEDSDGHAINKDSGGMSLDKSGVPHDIHDAEYAAMEFKETDTVYLTCVGDEMLLSSAPLKGDSPSILMLGPAAKSGCSHAECIGRSWCVITGWCEHPGCQSSEMRNQSGRVRCHLPKPRIGPHCRHRKCPSLLRCLGGRPVAVPGSEPLSVRMTRSEQSLRSSCGPSSPVLDRTLLPVAGSSSDKGKLVPRTSSSSSSSSTSVSATVGGNGLLGQGQENRDEEFLIRRRRPGPEASSVIGSQTGNVTSAVDDSTLITPPNAINVDNQGKSSASVGALDSVLQDHVSPQPDAVGAFDIDHDLDDGPFDLSAPGSGTDDLSRNAGLSPKVPKRKAGVLDELQRSSDDGQEQVLPPVEGSVRAASVRPVRGVFVTGVSGEARLLAVLKALGRRHRDLVDSKALEFTEFHEGRSSRDSLPLYTFADPTADSLELDLQIENLEHEIHYCLDLYHTSRESSGLGAGVMPASRDETWFNRRAQERYKRHRRE